MIGRYQIIDERDIELATARRWRLTRPGSGNCAKSAAEKGKVREEVREVESTMTPARMPTGFNVFNDHVMVRPDRFERPAFWFVARRSIQLSYGRNLAGTTLPLYPTARASRNPTSRRVRCGRRLPLQRIFHPGRRGVDQPPQLRFHFFHLPLHFPCDRAVAEMPLHAAAQARDVFGFGEIHLK